MVIWIALPVSVLFVFCLVKVAMDFSRTRQHSKKQERAEKLLAARFIKNAVATYKLRHARIDLVDPADYQRLCDEADDLVEQYYMELDNQPQAAAGVVCRLPV